MEFARAMGFKRVGIACCVGLIREARVLASILKENGFEVSVAVCKVGSIPKEELGLKDEEKVNPGMYEATCNPVGQAMVLSQDETDLNILLGLCVGHDSLFIKYSKAPVTCLATKDRVLCHNPLGAIYNASGYYRKKLYCRSSTFDQQV